MAMLWKMFACAYMNIAEFILQILLRLCQRKKRIQKEKVISYHVRKFPIICRYKKSLTYVNKEVWQLICNSGALSRAKHVQRTAPWVRKFGNLCIREILVVMWPYFRPTARPSAHRHHQYKISQSIGMANQKQLKVLFGRKSHGRPDF